MRWQLPKLPVLTAKDAEKILHSLGYEWVRSNGSHRIYIKDEDRIVIPFHSGKTLHPKIVKSVLELFDKSNE
jgi:predicted RNA binding protein YcfA (HicA-like mRNA interferase family)